MSTYPPYSFQQPQMNLYQNSYQPIQNPYMAQMGQLQQYQQSLQPQVQQQPQQLLGLNGKIVDDFNAITGNDVPMDGIGAIFFKNDGSEIQHRVWNATNGSIVTTSYKPVQPENQSEGANIPQMDFNALNEDVRALREDIMARLDAIEKSVSKPSARGKKTEVSVDE